MIEKNRGVLLKKIDWKSSNIIVEIFTLEYGKKSFIVYNAKKKFFSPIVGSQIEFITKKTKAELSSVSEWTLLSSVNVDISITYAVTFIVQLLSGIQIEHESLDDIYSLVTETIAEINEKYLSNRLIISLFLIKLIHIEGVIYLEEINCENCNSVIEKREELYFDFVNNKKYCKRCEKKGILAQYNSSILIFINWYIDRNFTDLELITLPFHVDELFDFLVKYVNINLIEIDNFFVLKKL